MKLIVGLGNPGFFYRGTRHNVGFEVIKSLASLQKVVLKRENFVPALVAKTKIAQQMVVLAQPLTFMNLSGLAVKALVKKYKIEISDLLVICDDLDLELGRIKIRPKGASSGQHGLESIIEHLNSQEFCRIRLGIGRPQNPLDAAKYVLSRFGRSEKESAKQAEDVAVDCCLAWVEKGIDETMNIFNIRSRNE